MRRLAATTVLAIATVACATPAIRLEPRYAAGEVRTYRLIADAETRIDVEGLRSTERTRLVATSRLEVTRAAADGATLAVRLTPTRFERDGRPVELPPRQEAVVEVGPDGALRSVTSVGGVPVEQAAEANVEALVPLLGAGYPSGRVRLGSRWTSELPDGRGTQRGRVAALRFVDGERAAIIALATRRVLELARPISGAELRLRGTETSAAEIAFAFDRGLPVRVTSEGEARMEVEGGSRRPGSVVIVTETELRLIGVER